MLESPFDTLVIVTKGKGNAMLGGETLNIKEGEPYYIPTGMRHSFWSEDVNGLEFIIIMYGKGAKKYRFI